jgi:hypothetical protein
MKVTPRFTIRAALVVTAAGVIGAFGACKSDNPVAPPPPPPPVLLPPSGLTATAASDTSINLAWTDNSTNETGFFVQRCSGAGCTAFANVGTSTAANIVAFKDSGLTAATSYSYRVAAFNATDTSAFSATATTSTTGTTGGTSITMIGAGEITSCNSPGASQTATLVQNQISADSNTIVFTVGNNVAAGPGAGSYTTCFDPNWGKFKTKNMWAALGTGDFESIGQDAIYAYFGDKAGAPNGYYSFNAGTDWHVIVLNTSTWQVGECNLDPTATGCAGKPTPMLDWLAADLAANTKPCIMAISWERRMYTSGTGSLGRNQNMNTIAGMLYGAGADILVSAKDKQYERFPKTNVDGVADAHGFSQFIIGTGGRSLDQMHTPAAGNLVAAQFARPVSAPANWVDSWGVVKFTLKAGSYDWEWVGTQPGAFTDSGSATCN